MYMHVFFIQAAEKRMSDPEGFATASLSSEDPYPDLSELEPVDLISFAYQIASGMVSSAVPCPAQSKCTYVLVNSPSYVYPVTPIPLCHFLLIVCTPTFHHYVGEKV